MTVSSTTTKVSYSGDGTTSAFAYSFKIFNDSDLVVIVRTDSTGAETTKTINTDYLVSNAGESDGGTVTFKFDTGNSGDSNYDTTDRRPQSGETVLLKRVMTLTQNTDYTPNDSFPAAAHEEALDKLTFIQQQQQEEIDRSFKFAQTDVDAQDLPASAERANKYLGFNSEGNAIAVDGTTNATTISTFGATLVDDANASAARTTLGLGSVATLSSIATANIDDNAIENAKMADDSVGADELIDNSVGAAAINISGNGTSGQYVGSDGDGSFSYITPPVAPTIQVFTTSGTWTKPTGCRKVKVTVVGGGGGGGGTDAITTAKGGSTGGGGGGASIKFIDVTSISSETVTVGAGGSGGSGGSGTPTNGSAGGTSSYGTHCSATGGGGGKAADRTIANANGVFGGVGSNGDINTDGTPPKMTKTSNAGNTVGLGGDSLLGSGGTPRIFNTTNGNVNTEANAPTIGGGGGGVSDNDGFVGGRAGADGIVIVEEYY